MARKNDDMNGRRRVAVVRLGAIGDVAMTVPVVYEACRANPGTDFVMVTRKGLEGIFVNPPANLQIMGADLNGLHKGPGGMLRLAADLGRIDTLVDLHGVLRTWILRARKRQAGTRVAGIDKGRADKHRLVRQGAMRYAGKLPTTIERYRHTFSRAGIETHADTPFNGLFGDQKPVNATDKVRIGIAPFAKHLGKVYPIEMMQQVVTEIAAQPDVEVLLFGGGPIETEILQTWANAIKGANPVQNMADQKLGFTRELEMMHGLDAMVSMDSANMHLAAIAGAPVVSIWGATHPAMGFTPWRNDPANNLGMQLECRPCSVFGAKQCHNGERLCLRTLTIDAVKARILDVARKNHQKRLKKQK